MGEAQNLAAKHDAVLAVGAELLRFEGLTLDLAGRTLTAADGHEIPLTRAEFAILSVLIRARGRALSRDQLLDAVAGRRAEPFDRSIDVLIGRVRRKIEVEPKAPRLILTIPGHGYKFEAKAARAVAGPEGPGAPEPMAAQESTTPAKPTPERRQLTVMVCSLAAATGSGLRLDAEERHEILRAFRACCSDSCSRFGGRLGDMAGETVHFYFGYPVAHEHNVEQAVRAGLAVVAAAARLDTGSAFPLGARVGIATGVAIAGAWPGEVSAEASALAQELTGRAACGTVLVSATTRRLAGGLFECRVLDDLSPAAYLVLGETPAETRFDALHAEGLTPLVGRKEEIALLGHRWHRAQAGDGNVVLLSGEAGIGKSRLVRELRNQLADRANPLICYCAPHQQESSYHPFIQHLEHTAGFIRGDSTATRLAKLRQLLAKRIDDPDVLALFAYLLSIPNDGSFVASDLSPRERRDRTTAALIGQVVAAAACAPVLLVFEDVHWMDETSLEILDALVDQITDLRVLLIITFRPEFIAPWSSHPQTTTVVLNRLDRSAAAQMVTQVSGGTMPDALGQRIIAQADGMPLFLEELTKAMLEVGAEASTFLPATLHDSLMERLDRLPAAKRTAQLGAAIGRAFSHELVAALSDAPETELRFALDQLVSSGLVARRGLPPDATYTFKHALVHTAAYESLPKSQRAAIHAQVVELLLAEEAGIEDSQPDLLGYHSEFAGLTERAVGYWRRAGERSVRHFANREALGHFQRALKLTEGLAPGPRKDQLEADLRVAEVVPLIAIHGLGSEAVEACAARAKALGERIPEWPGRFAADRAVWNACLLRQGGRALALARDLMSLAERDGNPVRIAIACRALGLSLLTTGKPAEADPVLGRGVALADALAETEFAVYGEDPSILCRLFRGLARCILGYPETGLQIVSEGAARARATNNPHWIAWSLAYLAQAQIVVRDAVGAERTAAAAIAVAQQHRLTQWLAFAQEWRGWALCQLGDSAQGLALLEEGVRYYRQTGIAQWQIRPYYYLAEGCFLAGRPEAALGHLEVALAHAKNYGEHYMSAETHRLYAEVLQTRGAPVTEIETHLHSARDIARRQAARLWELRATLSLARLRRSQRHEAPAHARLAPLYASFSEGLDLPDLIETRTLLSQTDLALIERARSGSAWR